jgi:hypothetical protein
MSHTTERRTQLRGLYVYKRLSMEAACAALHIGKTTGGRWKRDAASHGDDWDKARSAIALGDDNFSQLARKLLEDYLVQHQATIDLLREDKKTPAADRALLLASLADSFHKTMASFRKIAPELNRHAIALDALQRLAGFAQQRFPRHVPALLELLEPFGEELAKAYG